MELSPYDTEAVLPQPLLTDLQLTAPTPFFHQTGFGSTQDYGELQHQLSQNHPDLHKLADATVVAGLFALLIHIQPAHRVLRLQHEKNLQNH